MKRLFLLFLLTPVFALAQFVTANAPLVLTSSSSGGGAPSGPAGGVLGGTYPNPGFGTFTSATLLAAVSDANGTGTLVFGTSPTLTTPVIAGGLTASGSGANTFVGSTGTFITSTGANTLSGATTINDATTPSLTTATGKTNTGFVQINGKTSGALKITTADATAQTVTLTVAAQTVGAATITMPNTASVADTFVYVTLAQTLASKTLTTPVIATGLTATGAGTVDFSGATSAFKTPTGAVTIGPGAISMTGATTISGTNATTALTLTQTARTSGVLPYFKINIPADTAQTASTESPGIQGVTATRTWATTGTVALQREIFFPGPTYASASASQTFTDVFNMGLTPPVAGSNAIFTRGHTLGINDATSAASSITGGLIVATTYGTAATSVGIGGGNINAGGNLTAGGTLAVTGTSTLTGNTGVGQASSATTILNVGGTATGASASAIQSFSTVTASGNGQTLYGITSYPTAATVTFTGLNLYNLHSNTVTVTGSGTIAEADMLRIESAPTATTKYGIHQVGTDNNSYGGKTSAYNNVATAGWGQPAIYAAGRLTAQSAAVASVSTYTVGAADGSFEVSGNMNVTVSTALATTMTCTYTDESNTSRVMVLPIQQLTGSFVAGGAITGVGAWESPVMHIRCKASTTITIGTTAGTFTGVTYTVEGIIKQVN